jgi:hypothetical protein
MNEQEGSGRDGVLRKRKKKENKRADTLESVIGWEDAILEGFATRRWVSPCDDGHLWIG